jgi:hypothetical protein
LAIGLVGGIGLGTLSAAVYTANYADDTKFKREKTN